MAADFSHSELQKSLFERDDVHIIVFEYKSDWKSFDYDDIDRIIMSYIKTGLHYGVKIKFNKKTNKYLINDEKDICFDNLDEIIHYVLLNRFGLPSKKHTLIMINAIPDEYRCDWCQNVPNGVIDYIL